MQYVEKVDVLQQPPCDMADWLHAPMRPTMGVWLHFTCITIMISEMRASQGWVHVEQV